MTDKQRYYIGLGWRCAVLRQRAHLDQRQAAVKAGIDPRTWAAVESGRHVPRGWTVYRIARAFDGCYTGLAAGQVVGRAQ